MGIHCLLLLLLLLEAAAVATCCRGRARVHAQFQHSHTLLLGAATMTALFGMGYFWKIHSLWYFIFVQIVAGIYQVSLWMGWCCARCVASFFAGLQLLWQPYLMRGDACSTRVGQPLWLWSASGFRTVGKSLRRACQRLATCKTSRRLRLARSSIEDWKTKLAQGLMLGAL